MTRGLTRSDTASGALDLTTVELSNMAQGTYSISHQRPAGTQIPAFEQSRALGATTSETGLPVVGSIIHVDPDLAGGADDAGYAVMSYGYDPRGQVLSARRSHRLGDQSLSTLGDTVWGGEPMVFNDIGARGGSPLDRLESLTNAAVPLWGMAPAAETVLIDSTAASRDRAVFWRLYDPDTSTGSPPQWRGVSLSAASGAWQQSGFLYVPPLEETFAYDDDGDFTQDGRWDYGWDAENRLVSVTTRSGAVTAGAPELRLSFGYDAKSRRVRKVVEKKESGSWVTKSDVRFVYDGWNLVSEVEYVSEAAGLRTPLALAR